MTNPAAKVSGVSVMRFVAYKDIADRSGCIASALGGWHRCYYVSLNGVLTARRSGLPGQGGDSLSGCAQIESSRLSCVPWRSSEERGFALRGTGRLCVRVTCMHTCLRVNPHTCAARTRAHARTDTDTLRLSLSLSLSLSPLPPPHTHARGREGHTYTHTYPRTERERERGEREFKREHF